MKRPLASLYKRPTENSGSSNLGGIRVETHELILSCDTFVDEWSVKLAQFMRVLLVITSVVLIKHFMMRTFKIWVLVENAH